MPNRNLARGQKENLPTWKRVVLGLIGCAMLASLLGSQGAPKAQASQPVGDVIFNYPYNPAGSTSLNDLAYNKVDHTDSTVMGPGFTGEMRPLQGYEQAYTQDLSAQYNGAATPDHVVVSDNTLSFYGYGQMPYMDYVFTSADAYNTANYGNSFTLEPANMNFHSFSESGYLFNGVMTQEGGSTYYTGYALILSCANPAGMEENDAAAANTASLRLYYINHELWNTDTFTPGTISNTRTLIATLKTGILNLDPTAYRVSTEIDPTTRAFQVYLDGALQVSVSAAQVIGGAAGPQGFGFYTGYYLHDCTILTRILYEDVTVNTEPTTPTPTTSQVNFIDQGTGSVIRVPETENGVSGQRYRIVQPLTIDYEGTTYYLVSNDRTGTNRNDINLFYQVDPTQNVTTLYYYAPTPEELKTQPPVKAARVNGGDWDNGDKDAPVSVAAGDTIEYDITGYHPPNPIAMIMRGTPNASTDTTWLGQNSSSRTLPSGSTLTTLLQKQQISGATFVDLSGALGYNPAVPNSAVVSFLAQYSTWGGQPILAAWDATEPDLSVNPDAATTRVVAWVTADPATPGRYLLYLGGTGGVYQSAAPGTSILFYYFTRMTSCVVTNLHTDAAVSMSWMFYSCAYLTSLDLRSFNTSNVTDMSYMFANCSALTSVNMTSFNTSNVTDMNDMFQNCPSITSFDVSSFNTSNVTDMSYMFDTGSDSLTSLDVSNFNTSKVTNMQYMFGENSYLTDLDLSNFDTSNVTDMSYMFTSLCSLETLDLSSFNTSSVTSMYRMFQYAFMLPGALTHLDLSNFDTTNVIDMSSMFDGCSELVSVDVSSFNTSNALYMDSMFQGCSSLGTLDLSNFNTSNVTYMNKMFNGCSSLTDLNVSRFDVSNVRYFDSMFNGCSSLTTLDLSYWQLGAVPTATTTYMFSGCSHLTTLHLDSAPLDQLTGTATQFMSGTPATVYVKSTALAWLLGKAASQPYVIAPTLTGPAPQPLDWRSNFVTPVDWLPNLKTPVNWLDNFTGTLGSSGANHTTITDTIPDGLTIDTSTITGTESSTMADDAITWQVYGQTITWQVPTNMLPKTVSVIVTVNSGLADGTDFKNTAYVGADPTNTTYHRLKDGWRVTEQYYVYDGGPTTTQLAPDLVTLVPSGDAYNVQGPLDSLSGYTYYGYQRVGIDSDITTGTPPAPAYDDGVVSPVHSPDFSTTNQETIKLYYIRKAVTVTINFVDTTGAVVKDPITVSVPANTDYYLLMSYFNSFPTHGGTITMSYYDYMKNGDASVADVAPPVSPPALGATPVYPDASVPTFPASMMDTDRNVTLCFTNQQAVTVHFVEDGNPSHVLHDPETYFYYTTFYPSTVTRTDGATQVSLDADILSVESSASVRTYTYTSHYMIDSNPVQNGFPGTLSRVRDITLYFSTSYTVTEKFHGVYDAATMAAAPVLAPDLVHPDLSGGYVFNPLDDPTGTSMPPAQIGNYIYMGYKFVNDSNPLIPGYPPAPLIDGVWDDSDIIYVYDKAPGVDFTFTKLGEGAVPLEGVTFKLTPRNSEDTGWDSAEASLVASATDGTVTFSSLKDKTSYLLEETQTLSGYALPSGYWILSVDTSADPVFNFQAQGSPMAFAYDKDTGAYTLTNYKVTHLPFSGSWGVIIFVVAGTVLLGLAALTLTSLRGKGRHARHSKKPKHASA